MRNKEQYYGKEITSATLIDNELRLVFKDDSSIIISDEEAQCCEVRYMTTDDDISFLQGKTLTGIIEKEVSTDDEDGDSHDIVFLEIQTNEGCVTFVNHNEHNGYYGGFSITIREVK